MNTWIDVKQVKKNVDDFRLGPINLTIEPGTITKYPTQDDDESR